MIANCAEFTDAEDRELLVFNIKDFENYLEVGIALGIVTEAYCECDEGLTYHNLQHTLSVAGVAAFLARRANCSEDEIARITTAALLHDIGYVRNENGDRILQEDGHQERSANIFRQFAKQHREFFGNNDEVIKRYAQAIQCTDLKTNHKNDLFALILLDADLWLMMLDKQEFLALNGALKNECCCCKGWRMKPEAEDDHLWYTSQKNFIAWRKFLSPYAKDHWEERRLANVAALDELAQKTAPEPTTTPSPVNP